MSREIAGAELALIKNFVQGMMLARAGATRVFVSAKGVSDDTLKGLLESGSTINQLLGTHEAAALFLSSDHLVSAFSKTYNSLPQHMTGDQRSVRALEVLIDRINADVVGVLTTNAYGGEAEDLAAVFSKCGAEALRHEAFLLAKQVAMAANFVQLSAHNMRKKHLWDDFVRGKEGVGFAFEGRALRDGVVAAARDVGASAKQRWLEQGYRSRGAA